MRHLNLSGLESPSEEGEVRGSLIGEEDTRCQYKCYVRMTRDKTHSVLSVVEEGDHSLGVHRLSGVELVVL